jgi:hypothetical protein
MNYKRKKKLIPTHLFQLVDNPVSVLEGVIHNLREN